MYNVFHAVRFFKQKSIKLNKLLLKVGFEFRTISHGRESLSIGRGQKKLLPAVNLFFTGCNLFFPWGDGAYVTNVHMDMSLYMMNIHTKHICVQVYAYTHIHIHLYMYICVQ